jgi:hypothetical protein
LNAPQRPPHSRTKCAPWGTPQRIARGGRLRRANPPFPQNSKFEQACCAEGYHAMCVLSFLGQGVKLNLLTLKNGWK